jgi:hypothetical protein
MPPQDTNNLRGNQFDVFINGADAPFHMTVSVGPGLDLGPVMTQRHGSTPIAMIVQGHKADLTFEFQEWTIEDLKRWNGIVANTAAVNKLPAVGTKMPTNSVRLHNPGDGADTTRDIVFPAVVFAGVGFNIDGTANHKQSVAGTAILDAASGDVVQIGYVAA